MPVLSVEAINNHFVENRYLLNVIHNPNSWSTLAMNALPAPIRIRFDENIKTNMPAALRNNKGIYMFFLEPNHPFSPELYHLLYIGRVREGESSYNFFRRFDEYKGLIGNVNGSLNKVLLTNLWPDYTHVFFYSLNHLTDEEITELEDEMIKKIVPPLNSKIGGKTEQTRNLY
ncbi:MAG: hypothetical protein IPF63_04025 [Bacteroidetes bacterium]|jgi:hypothetical protein|nr:hypothetical protein [Bacteroidota bacterium]MBL0080070.1 hypothetical protein [Bacteroidota bacterium]MBL0287753.1 hypothetical protein [Bacteroidota bacterium]